MRQFLEHPRLFPLSHCSVPSLTAFPQVKGVGVGVGGEVNVQTVPSLEQVYPGCFLHNIHPKPL